MKNMHDRDPIRHDAVENQVPAERAPPDSRFRMPRDKWKGERCVTQTHARCPNLGDKRPRAHWIISRDIVANVLEVIQR
jgi:hypothetical protein